MAYGTPSDPVAGTVITVAYAVANILDPIRALRAFTGGADPPGSNYVVASTSTSATTWAKVTSDMMAAGAAVTNIGYTPANKAGETFTGSVSISGVASDLVVGRNITATGNIGTVAGQITAASATISGSVSAGSFIGATIALSSNASVSGTATLGALVVGNNGSVGGTFSVAGAFSGAAATLSGTLTGVAAAFSGALSALSAAITNNLTVGGTVVAGSTVQGTRLISTIASGTAPFTVTSDTEVTNLKAANGVPTDGVIFFPTNAALTAAGPKWTTFTAGVGRLLVGAGASASSQTFTEAVQYGSTWTPASALGVSDGKTVSITTSGHGAGQTGEVTAGYTPISVAAGGIAGIPTAVHWHAVTATLGGTISLTGQSTVWLPYMTAGVWGQKLV